MSEGMTREQARDTLRNAAWLGTNEDRERIERAVELLCGEPCEGAISRADVIDAIGSWLDSGEWRYTNATEYLKKRVKNLPPVHAEPHISCDGCEYEHYKEFNERCKYCCRGKNDKYYAEGQA